MRYQLGSPLRGPDALTPPLDGSSLEAPAALTLEVTIVALAAPLQSAVPSVVRAARLVLHEGEAGRALGASPVALAGASAGPIDDAGELLQRALTADPPGRLLREVQAVVLPGATTVVELFRDAPSVEATPLGAEPPSVAPDAAPLARASVLLGREADSDALEPALEWEDGRSAPELVALESLPIVKGRSSCWAAFVPSPFAEGARTLLFIARASGAPAASSPGSAVHEEEVALAARSLAAQAAQAERIQRPAPPPPTIPDLVATRRALGSRETSRRALFNLALATGARTAEEIAVSVEDHAFARIASGVAAALASSVAASASPREIGLVVEKATLASCREIGANEDPPEDLNAALERRGGAAFYLLSSSLGEVDKTRSLDELDKLIESQNVALLEDASPQIRVRAARWLESRSRDLAGFSALAPAAERRAALQRLKARKPAGAGP